MRSKEKRRGVEDIELIEINTRVEKRYRDCDEARMNSLKERKTTPTLFKLIRKRRWEKVLWCMKTDCHEEALYQNEGGNTCLHYACYRRPPVEVVAGLLKYSVQPNNRGYTPLHVACAHGASLEVITLLSGLFLEKASGRQALHVACGKGNIDAVLTLLKYYEQEPTHDGYGRTPLHWLVQSVACKKSNKMNVTRIVEMVQFMADQFPSWLLHADADGCTPLHIAVRSRSVHLIRILLEKNSLAAEMVDFSGSTPLHVALVCCPAAVPFLLNGKGAAQKDALGSTPLHLACTLGYPYRPVVKSLLEISLNKYEKDAAGFTPLARWLQHGRPSAEDLQEFEQADSLELRTAARMHDASVVRAVSAICSTECLSDQDADGQTALHLFLGPHLWAPEEADEREDLVWQWLETMPKLAQIADNNGNLPLHLAVGPHPAGIMAALLKWYPQGLKITNKEGHSPFDLVWSCECGEFWRKATFIWKVLYTGHVGPCVDLEFVEDFSILHAAASTPCPPRIMRQLLEQHNPSKHHRNELAMALAARTPIYRPISIKTLTSDETVLQLLAEATPQTLLSPQIFITSLRHGKEWHEGVSNLYHKIPGVLSHRDNGLWPPMVAALGGCSLTTIYELLRRDPSLCQT